MKVVYTLHAVKQMKERKIIKVWVEETIKNPDVIKKEGRKRYATKKLNGHLLRVVYLKEQSIKVITAFFTK